MRTLRNSLIIVAFAFVASLAAQSWSQVNGSMQLQANTGAQPLMIVDQRGTGKIVSFRYQGTEKAYVDSSGFSLSVAFSGTTVQASQNFNITSKSVLNSPANGQFNFENNTGTAGVGFDFGTDSVLKIRNRSQNAFAAITASQYNLSASGLIQPLADGVFQLVNNGQNGFTRLVLGTNDTSGAAIVKNGTGLDVTDGSNSNFTALRALTVTATSSFSSTATTGTVVSNATQSVANNGIINLLSNSSTTIGLLIVTMGEDNDMCMFALRGGGVPTEISDPAGICTNASGGASSINVYYSSGYKLENKRGATRTIRLMFQGAS